MPGPLEHPGPGEAEEWAGCASNREPEVKFTRSG